MIDYNKIYNELISNGYYIGNSYDIFSEEELVNLEAEITDILPNTIETNKKWSRCISACFEDKELEKNNSFISYSEIEDRKKFISDNNGIITQQWYFSDLESLQIKNLDYILYRDKIRDFVRIIYNIDFYSVNVHQINVTHYVKDDFIDQHRDGQNSRRLCAFLLYFGDNKLYSKEQGGRLFVSSDDSISNYKDKSIYDEHFISVEPIRPNYVILDFTKHNVIHAVEKCFTDFHRYALLCFPIKEIMKSNL